MDQTLQIRSRGTSTLPADLREKYNIKSEDSFRLVDLDGVLITFNLYHYNPGHPDVTVLRPGAFTLQVKDLLTRL